VRRAAFFFRKFEMFAFLLIVQTLIAVSLIAVILMQRSEGGGLGVGGSSSGFMTARGAADFLTRSTAVLGALFIVLSIVMAAIAGASRQPTKIDTSLANSAAPLTAPTSAPPATQQQQPQNSAAPATNPQQNQPAPAVPLAQ
jgi:preprotein translocase subunit SecG